MLYMRGWVYGALLATALASAGCAPSSWAASALIHPLRRTLDRVPPGPVETFTVHNEAISIKGWRFPARGQARATLVFLHGVADNRASGIGIAQRFTTRGFTVIAYDSRAHGESTGDACTYGYYEKKDLTRVLDTVRTSPIVVLGHSLGAAVALQAAAVDDRISSVVAVETFSDLRTVAQERAPFVLTKRTIAKAFAEAESRAAFRVDDVSPVQAARHIRVPVLLIHGAEDRETRPEHSRRVYDALSGPKRLIIVPKTGHNGSLTKEAWNEIEVWIDQQVTEAKEP